MNESHFAVVVGINRYPGVDTQLESAKYDAARFHEWLTDPHGGAVPSEQAKCLSVSDDDERAFTSNYDARPIRHEMNTQLGRFHDQVWDMVGQRASDWMRTRLYIYVAGHGIAPSLGRGSLLFPDAKPTRYWGDYLDLSHYADYYERHYLFREIFIFADCCREFSAGVPPALGTPFGDDFPAPPEPPRRYVGYATAIGSKAYEPIVPPPDSSNGRGFFTTALLEGLRGKAADPATGNVEILRLVSYIRTRVTELAGDLGYQQTADITGSIADPTVLCTVRTESYSVEITFARGSLPPASLRSGSTTVETWPGGPGPWRTMLTDGLYDVVLPDLDVNLLDGGSFEVHGGAVRVSV